MKNLTKFVQKPRARLIRPLFIKKGDSVLSPPKAFMNPVGISAVFCYLAYLPSRNFTSVSWLLDSTATGRSGQEMANMLPNAV